MAIGIILAAGNSTRFGKQSKLFVDLLGKCVLDYAIDLCRELELSSINIVVKEINEQLNKCNIDGCDVHIQNSERGTGAAVKSVMSGPIDDDILVLLGDCPLVNVNSMKNAFDKLNKYDLVIGGVKVTDFNHAYGRIKIENENILSIEESTVNNDKTEFRNAGWMLCKGKYFHDLLSKIPEINGEYYLTECVRLANEFGMKVGMIEIDEDIGINTVADYVKVSNCLQNILRDKAIRMGCIMSDPNSVHFSANTKIESNVTIDPYVVFKKSVVLRENSCIKSFSCVENSEIGQGSIVGPFANIRQGTVTHDSVQLGAFVETKNSVFKNSSKAKHLSYIGDAEIGENVNIGAGSVFCNYDGKKKSKSVVKDGSFLGANTTYVAPIKIGKDVKIGAGSVITKDVGDGKLAVSRSVQKEYKGKK